MLKMSFEEFFDGQWEDGDYCLYIVKDRDDFLYIGITRDNPYNRWFGLRGHMPYHGEINSGLFSTIGRRISDNMPESKEYTIELYSLEEARELTKTTIEERGYYMDRVDIESCEEMLIKKHCPFDNITHNTNCSHNWDSVRSFFV